MGRPREHDDQTRAALLAAAEELLSRQGEQGLAVRAVADAVGTTTRAVYSVFGGKDGLLRALYVRAFTLLGERVAGVRASDDPAADLVAVGVRGFRWFATTHPNLFRLTFEGSHPELAPTTDDIGSAVAARRRLSFWVARCAEAGRLGGRDVADVTWQFHALCQGLASVELRGWLPRGRDPARVWRDALEAFVAGLAARRA